ncbi:hypothetical protein C0Q70_03463 [Pomacea canaliculata]|uniref:Uncharacterized protein n=1 Tax=Pomacea canaliculata TaxID=400727 RepID=A0A2T7PST4_POMCA|nr:hypothetical protein C0Q70_03463 [Pomacea canaliculata]
MPVRRVRADANRMNVLLAHRCGTLHSAALRCSGWMGSLCTETLKSQHVRMHIDFILIRLCRTLASKRSVDGVKVITVCAAYSLWVRAYVVARAALHNTTLAIFARRIE